MTHAQLLFGRRDSTHSDSHPWPEFEAVNDTVRGGASTSRWTVVDGQRQGNVGSFSGVLGAFRLLHRLNFLDLEA